MILITKRDGALVPFESDKIRKAVLKATAETQAGEDSDLARLIAGRVEAYYSAENAPECTVEDVQDMVEKLLMDSDNKEAAKKYILYRDKRSRERMKNTEFMRTIGEKLKASNVQNQNANVDEASFGGRKGEAANELLRRYAIENLLSPLARERHGNNEIYIHDLDSYAVGNHNCLTIPFDDLLANGFNTRQTDVRPANSINTAFQLLAVIFQLQSLQQFGGCSAGHLDWTMVPYVRKSFYKHFCDGFAFQEGNYPANEPNIPIKDLPIDDRWYAKEIYDKPYHYALEMTKRELKQAVEGMYHNLNTLQSRSGNQLPFTSINYGTCTLPEGRMVTRALLEGSIAGVGKLHRTPIFPCGIFQCAKGINRRPGDPNYDLFRLALKSTALRLYPNYANIDWSNNAGYDKNDPRTYFGTMGCRTANLMDVNGLGQLKDGRGNICPVTVILPTIAMQAKEITAPGEDIVDNFLQLLDHRIVDAKEMLLERFNYICSQPPEAAKFMYENRLMAGYVPEEGIRSALKHGTLAIGQLGLAECLQILVGCNHLDPKGMELAKKIEQLFKDRCAEFKKECQLNFGVYYTPAETLCYTAMQRFRKRYGIIPNVSDREYFTNSMHVPVWEKISVFKKIDTEAQLTGYSSAGCITYIELEDSVKNNINALETYVNYAMDHDIPYFAINVPNDTCLDCGYCDEFNDRCPKCGSTHIQQLRRVTGYLTNDYKTAFNKGKQAEVKDRFQHTKAYSQEWNTDISQA